MHVFYGSADGLTTLRDQRWEPRSPGLDGYYSYRLGEVLETGDFNGDGYAELAIGVPDLCCENYVGHLRILYGSASGLTAEGNQLWSELSPGLKGPLPPNDNDVGWASDLVAGDFGKGPEDDLAIPEPLNQVLDAALRDLEGCLLPGRRR